ncbi:20 kDa chaperonin, chloroplastic-like [Papaver somniferum]|uniref:20 kDa chaperonin, chloroplastic-like n=1 Tax=Papaver somniferum TaxID=3469 RepID=UPI000E6FDF7D|nr:20 kDa chaperonin, chloroplastic-like [Papaver somniferum]
MDSDYYLIQRNSLLLSHLEPFHSFYLTFLSFFLSFFLCLNFCKKTPIHHISYEVKQKVKLVSGIKPQIRNISSSQFERNSNPSFLSQKLKGNDAAVTVLAVGRHKPLGDRVLVVTKTAEQKTTGGIQSPSTAQTKPQGSELLAIEKVKTVGKAQVDVSVKNGAQIIYSKYAGTEVDLNGVSHLLLNNDGIVGILETEDVKDFKPLSERVLVNVEEAEKETAGGLLLTEDSKEKPSIGTVYQFVLSLYMYYVS